jgi:hypothetical protein
MLLSHLLIRLNNKLNNQFNIPRTRIRSPGNGEICVQRGEKGDKEGVLCKDRDI